MPARLRGDCKQASWLARSFWPVPELGQSQLSESASGQARGRRRLGFPALDQEPQEESGHARGVLRPARCWISKENPTLLRPLAVMPGVSAICPSYCLLFGGRGSLQYLIGNGDSQNPLIQFK